ncbi:hypothetical protein N7532_007055 [Penicillium argentinense]|uniref:Transcription initiation factor TFIID subunit 4 n=1 Tax=Penicillium argentinense TaxID=1131581 RepID=A0A9W9FH55_9EURO|nr:uncharacterized protein N7532_007055 [Penicillium argentinense]KAJ5100054.1 hypothetical protein N7532_007055 [Penicillium argentinense]
MQLPPQGQLPINGMPSTNLPSSSLPSTPMAQQAAPPPAAPGAMGPPSVPPSRPVDASELTDVLASSGIDVREEEAFLTHSFGGRNAQAQTPARGPQHQQPPTVNTSFTSQPTTTGTLSASSSFSETPHAKPTIPQGSFPAESSSQDTGSIKEPSREDSEAARRSQYHLQEPFLLTKLLEQRIQKRGFELGVRIPSEGLFHPVPGRPQPIEVTGPDGSSVIRTGQTILNQEGAPLVDILNLVSLACEERLRGVVDYSSSLARSRRAHSHGVVPTEWKDVAKPLGPANGNTATPSKRVYPYKVPIRTDGVTVLTHPVSLGPHSDVETESTKPTAERCRGLVGKETSIENKRATKRTKRSTNAILGESAGIRAESNDPTGSAPSTPIADRAPGFDKKSMSKKEARKMIDSKESEAQQHKQSVETARLATNSMLSGRMFGAKKSYSWLKPGGSSSGFSSPARPAPATPTPGGEKSAKGRSGESTPGQAKRRLGTWREDQEKGAGIQVRDVLFMLEVDGRGTKHVQKGYSKDPKEDRAP